MHLHSAALPRQAQTGLEATSTSATLLTSNTRLPVQPTGHPQILPYLGSPLQVVKQFVQSPSGHLVSRAQNLASFASAYKLRTQESSLPLIPCLFSQRTLLPSHINIFGQKWQSLPSVWPSVPSCLEFRVTTLCIVPAIYLVCPVCSIAPAVITSSLSPV